MSVFHINLKPIVAAAALTVWFSAPVAAQSEGMDDLFARLKSAEPADAALIEREIEMEWRKSGSPAMDLLLKRGREAMEAEDFAAAIDHFTALSDHAPGFAEGWHGRAQAYVRTERMGPAVADLKRVLSINPRQFHAIYGLGTLFEQIDRPDQAYDAYRLVLDLYPHHEDAQERLNRLEKDVNGVEL
ncbi:hypothetical protein RXV86_08920 [Alisedimentitalea sp. MJ-SS2]|uniref:tetratricopeptide repeat protein n=1 Tax=Aliisedimentitalea sp. MJ-SS2 TaxID=3049795 RepID=UPI002907A571|nr:tetratricopeptide repeat protein [Alisedimentitalea sp. MJ-SS2]MDU8927503.1 hypothetical protein [Alisedimentitalea sp. MJ-SS2]